MSETLPAGREALAELAGKMCVIRDALHMRSLESKDNAQSNLRPSHYQKSERRQILVYYTVHKTKQ